MKNALITGGSSGIGFEIAKLLGQQGYNLILLARNQERLEKAAQKLKDLKLSVKTYSCDITDGNQLKKIAENLEQNSQNIDFLVLSAGIVTVSLLEDYPDEQTLLKDINVDLLGTILTIYHFQHLINNGAKVLFISSGFGLMGAAGYTMYCAAKAGVINFAQAWRREVLHRKIKVFVAAPADVDTPMLEAELASQPEWMKQQAGPRKSLPASVVAKRILRKTNKKKFLILPSSDVKLLYFIQRFLPQTIVTWLLDKLFPVPYKK